MILRPVLVPVPGGADLPRPRRLPTQRRAARLAVDQSARLSGWAPRPWPQDSRGAPRPADGVYWSLSHKPAWTAGVVSDQPVGIDIELLAPRHNLGLFDKLADADEWTIAGDRTWHTFFRLWTAKEAALKANGVGIGHLGDCRLVTVRDETHLTVTFAGREWIMEHFVHDGHLASVTATEQDVVWNVANPAPEGR